MESMITTIPEVEEYESQQDGLTSFQQTLPPSPPTLGNRKKSRMNTKKEQSFNRLMGSVSQRQQTVEQLPPQRYDLYYRRRQEHASHRRRHRKKDKTYRLTSIVPFTLSSLCDWITRPQQNTTFVATLMRWTFRTTTVNVFLSILLAYFVLVFVFSAIVFGIGRYQPECIEPEGKYFMDAFHLSWTTLSTVGYGATYPQNANSRGEGELCVGINMTMAYEAYIGVLFGGITGAIIYGKITHIQNFAQVSFSDPICIRYGPGVLSLEEEKEKKCSTIDYDSYTDEDKKENSRETRAFPVLEFRVSNDMVEVDGGEIVDASLAVSATISVTKDDKGANMMLNVKNDRSGAHQRKERRSSVLETSRTVAQSVGVAGKAAASRVGTVGKLASRGIGSATMASINATKGIGKGMGHASKNMAQSVGSAVAQLHRHLRRKEQLEKAKNQSESDDVLGGTPEESETSSYGDEKELEEALEKLFEARFVEKLEREREKLDFMQRASQQSSYVVRDEGNSELCPARRVHKLDIETDRHPFFKRVWMVRHELNESSPLWCPEAHRLIARNDGKFPAALNSHQAIREHLRFNELLVSFTGTLNNTGGTVFAHKVYDRTVLNVGYTFAAMLYACPSTHRLLVDSALLNDIREQNGGGGEPLQMVRDRSDGTVDVILDATLNATNAAADAVGTVGSMAAGCAQAVTTTTIEGATSAVNAFASAGKHAVETATFPND